MFALIFTDQKNDSSQQRQSADTPQGRSQKESNLQLINTTVCDNPGVGYWTGDIWNALSCSKVKQWKYRREVGECFRNKNIYLLGDSTTRQWFITLLELLHKKVPASHLQYSYSHYFKDHNFNFTFQFYPHILGSQVVPIDKQKFEVDILDTLRDSKCNYVVTISPWAHFAQWWLPAYKERLKRIREAIKRFKKRCPDAAVVVKSPHVRNHRPHPSAQYMSSDYILFQIKIIMEEMLNIDEVYYIDIWNMNLAYPANNTIHMPKAVVKQEINLFLSYICPYFDARFHGQNLRDNISDKVSGTLLKHDVSIQPYAEQVLLGWRK